MFMDLEIRHLQLVAAVAEVGSLTRAGERLLASARDVLERLTQAEHDIREMGRDRAGVLRITTECYTCYHWLPPLLMRYRRTFPKVDVRIDVEATHHPIEMLLA